MENKRDQIQLLANTFNKYREDVKISLKNGDIMENRFVLQEQLFQELKKIDIDLSRFRTFEYINELSFGKEDKTFIMIHNIENQLENVFNGNNTINKTIKDIFEEKNTYIDSLSSEQQKKYKNLKTDPLYYLLLGGTYEPYGNEGKLFYVIDEEKLAKDLIKNKEKAELSQKVFEIITSYRDEINDSEHSKNIDILQKEYSQKFHDIGINTFIFEKFHEFIDKLLFNGRGIYKSNLKDNDIEDTFTISEVKIYYFMKEDPVWHFIAGSTPDIKNTKRHVIDDKKLAQMLVDFNS